MDRTLRGPLLVSVIVHMVLLFVVPRWLGPLVSLVTAPATQTVRRVVVVNVEGNEHRFLQSTLAFATGRGDAFGGPPAMTEPRRPAPPLSPPIPDTAASAVRPSTRTEPAAPPPAVPAPPSALPSDTAAVPEPRDPPREAVAEPAPVPDPVARTEPVREEPLSETSVVAAEPDGRWEPVAEDPASPPPAVRPEGLLYAPTGASPVTAGVMAPDGDPVARPAGAFPRRTGEAVEEPRELPIRRAPLRDGERDAGGSFLPRTADPVPEVRSPDPGSLPGPLPAPASPVTGPGATVEAIAPPSPPPSPAVTADPASDPGRPDTFVPLPNRPGEPIPQPDPELSRPVLPDPEPRAGRSAPAPDGEGIPAPARMPGGTAPEPEGGPTPPIPRPDRGLEAPLAGAVMEPGAGEGLPAPTDPGAPVIGRDYFLMDPTLSSSQESPAGMDVTGVPDDKARLAPVPLTPLTVEYPDALKGSGLDGHALVRLWLDGDGQVNRWEVANFRGDEAFLDAIAQAVERWRFRVHPAWNLAGRESPVIVVPVHIAEGD